MPNHLPRDRPIHTPNCPGGTCDDPETTFLCDVCGRECAACFGVSESETCDDCEGKMKAKVRYYCLDNENGFDEYHTEKQAKSAAETMLELTDEFSDDTSIEYGAMIPLGELREFNRRDTPTDEDESARWKRFGWSYVCDHKIEAVTTLDNHLASECVRLQDEANELRAKLEEADKQLKQWMHWADSFLTDNDINESIADSAGNVDHKILRDAMTKLFHEQKSTIAQLRQADTVRPAVDAPVDGDCNDSCDCIHCR